MYSSEPGPYKVVMKRGEFVDSSRDRAVPYKAYVPVDHDLDRVPVVLWSHGFGGNRDGAAFISRYLASYGYLLFHMTHDGTDSSLWEGKPEHPWDILRKVKIARETTLARFEDVPFVMDQLPQWVAENDDLKNVADLSQFGMSGHSFGAMTTQVMAGQMFPNVNDELISMRDERISCGVLYSPVPAGHLKTGKPPEELYGPIDIPLLHMTGTDDSSPLEDFGYEHRLVIHKHAQNEEQYVQVLEGGDHMVYNGTRGKLTQNPLREQHEDEIKIAALAFWNAYLKDDDRAMAWVKKNL